jgi:glycosyltransferase involved in cell wall biosynthesis
VRILVYPHRMTIGGIQINAIDLAAAVRDRGHDVVVSSTPGPLVDLVKERNLPFVPIPARGRFRPAPVAIRWLRSIVRRNRIDLVHAHGTYACLEAFYGGRLLGAIPVVGSHMGMVPPVYFPRTVPLIVGTRDIFEHTLRFRRGTVRLLEPPIDTEQNHPSFDGSGFRRSFRVKAGEHVVVITSRLSFHRKLDSLETAIDAVAQLSEEIPVRLFVIGDGEAREALEERTRAVNAASGRDVVTMTGWMLDPRPAYAAADVVVGMGSSILRGMAFAKPAIVLGERGFSDIVAPDAVDQFLRQGFHGIGNGHSPARPLRLLRELLADPDRRNELARFSRRLVCERFSLHAAAAVLEEVYRSAVEQHTPRLALLGDGVRTGARVMRHKARKLVPSRARRRQIGPKEDG